MGLVFATSAFCKWSAGATLKTVPRIVCLTPWEFATKGNGPTAAVQKGPAAGCQFVRHEGHQERQTDKKWHGSALVCRNGRQDPSAAESSITSWQNISSVAVIARQARAAQNGTLFASWPSAGLAKVRVAASGGPWHLGRPRRGRPGK